MPHGANKTAPSVSRFGELEVTAGNPAREKCSAFKGKRKTATTKQKIAIHPWADSTLKLQFLLALPGAAGRGVELGLELPCCMQQGAGFLQSHLEVTSPQQQPPASLKKYFGFCRGADGSGAGRWRAGVWDVHPFGYWEEDGSCLGLPRQPAGGDCKITSVRGHVVPSDLRCFLPEGCQAQAPKCFGLKQDEPGGFLPSTGLEQPKLKQKVPRLTSQRVLLGFCVEWTQRRERRHMGLCLSFPSPL